MKKFKLVTIFLLTTDVVELPDNAIPLGMTEDMFHQRHFFYMIPVEE